MGHYKYSGAIKAPGSRIMHECYSDRKQVAWV